MIQLRIDENEPLGQFILNRAQQSGKTPEEVAMGVLHEMFQKTIHHLHKRFMVGEFTQGDFADRLGLERIDLIHLLDDMGLPATNI